MCESLMKSAKKTPSNRLHENPKKRSKKSPKMEKRERDETPLNLLYIIKDPYKTSLPPKHPSLSKDLAMKLSS